MAERVYIIARRRDLDGMNIQVTDLKPNTSQKNSNLDGEGQTGYLKWSIDVGDTTQVSGDSYVKGSTNTFPLPATAADDTTGGGNDVTVSASPTFGLIGYLRERVHVNPGGDDDFMTSNEAEACAADILDLVVNGSDVTVAAVNAVLNTNLSGADNSLDGTNGAGTPVAGSTSFGDIEEVLQIMQGAVYRTRAFTILADETGAWLGLTAREVLEAAQDTGSNGGVTFYAQGEFLERGEAGFRDVKETVRSGAFNGSVTDGQLHTLANVALVAINPNFAYSAGAVTSWRPRATFLSGGAVPSTGSGIFCAVYDKNGNLLS